MELNDVNSVNENLSDELLGKYLTFYVDGSIYGLSLFNVLEIIEMQSITKAPNLPNYIKGIMNLRGKIVPVIDVRLKFNKPEKPYDEKTSIIIVEIGQMQVGLIVDSVADVESAENGTLTKPSEMNRSAENKYLSSLFVVKEKVVLIIDCEKFFRDNIAQV